MRKFRAAVLCLAGLSLLLVGGCKTLRGANACNKRQPYQSAYSVAPLTMPAGASPLDTATVLKLPALREPAPPARTTRDPCLDVAPSYKVAKPAPAPQA